MRRRIILSILGITAVSLLVFSVPLALAARHLYRSRALSRLDASAAAASAGVASSALGTNDPIELPKAGRRGVHVTVVDVRARRLAGDGAIPTRLVRTALGGRVARGDDGGVLGVALPITDQERVVGAAVATQRRGDIDHQVERLWLAMLAVALTVLAAAAGVAQRAGRRLTAPVDDLIATSEALGHGDFSVRTPRHGFAELDAAAAALDATAARLDQLLNRERAFSADVSHQLSTPLTALRLVLEEATLTGSSETAVALERAVHEVDRLQDTVAEMLAVSRAGDRARSLCDLGAIAAAAAEPWHGSLAAQGRPLRVGVDADLPAVRASSVALRQVMDVLLENATIHGRGEVRVRATTSGGGVLVEVSDEGAGVSDATAVFDRLPRADGHGIGLGLARSLAAAEGGELLLRSAGPQPVFVLVMPAAQSR